MERPKNVASLHGRRDAKEQKFLLVLTKVNRRCQAVEQIEAGREQGAAGPYKTRSEGSKKLFKLLVPV